MAVNITLEELLEAGAHFGHQARRWNPKMKQYLYGVKDGVHVFDLAKTKEALVEALAVLEKYAKEGKTILFVGTKKQAKDYIKKLGESTGNFYVNERWLGGTLTNFDHVMASVRKLAEFKEGMATGQYNSYTKKEKLLKQREIDKLERNVGGISKLEKKPDLMVIVDTHREQSALREAARVAVPVIGIVDSNADPSLVTWPIPMNDDASKSLELVIGLMEKVLLSAKGKQAKTSKAPKKKVKVGKEEEDFDEAN